MRESERMVVEGKARPSQLLLGDPLSDVTRKERRLLLIVAVTSVAVVKTGALPTKISSLGIDFTPADRTIFVWALAAVLAYFVIAFLVYALADIIARRALIIIGSNELSRQIKDAAEATSPEAIADRVRWNDLAADEAESLRRARIRDYRSHRRLAHQILLLAFGRLLFEFGLPLIVGAYAMATLYLVTLK